MRTRTTEGNFISGYNLNIRKKNLFYLIIIAIEK